MAGLESYRASEIRQVLIDRFGYSEEDAKKIKGKGDLAIAIKEECDEQGLKPEEVLRDNLEDSEVPEVDFSEVEMETETMETNEIENEQEEKPARPLYSSPEWNEYVLSHFADDELVDDHNTPGKKLPTQAGLRRVAELLLGDIVFSGPTKLEASLPEGDPRTLGRAYCVYEIRIAWKLDQYYITQDDVMSGKFPVRVFSAAAGSFLGNTDDLFSIYPEAIAETRAEVRALRKALGLKVVGADEVFRGDVKAVLQANVFTNNSTDGEWSEEDGISGTQKATIKMMCTKHNIDVEKFINKKFYTGKSKDKAYNSIDEVPKGIAKDMIKELNKYQTEAGEESKNIPKEILNV